MPLAHTLLYGVLDSNPNHAGYLSAIELVVSLGHALGQMRVHTAPVAPHGTLETIIQVTEVRYGKHSH